MFLLLIALIAAADAGAPEARPPAQLVIPPSVRKQREADQQQEEVASQLGLLAPEVLQALGPMAPPKPGEWVEYAIRDHGQPAVRVRLSILPPPPDAAEGRYWLEVATVGVGVLPAAVKLLVHGDPRVPGDIERLVIYVAGQAPLEVPADEAPQALGPVGSGRSAKVTQLKRRAVRVPAGTFTARGLQISVRTPRRTTRVWLAKDAVPLWGLVSSDGDGRSLELLEFGKAGAHTVVPPAPGEPDERPDGGMPGQGNGNDIVK